MSLANVAMVVLIERGMSEVKILYKVRAKIFPWVTPA